ncbi:DUF2852 domain-containing protein [Pseudaestuariivita atlantica]|uniref:DUF2852 domain-containing protein n=1 Tax=Pseudaestuariivita atlantica TaxID=1317121 RepID=A0A0L1JVN9_9RHOB|nr:DUF2852 domain-containing protein [Pseudaestuariivita atlantica]KNG95433.1 hypothetical protein ATO11_02180 [Pseudaestuariivita atlantica]
MTHTPDTSAAPATAPRMNGFVLIVTMGMYAGFAIPVSIIAMDQSFYVGIVLAAFLAWQWGNLPRMLMGAPAQMPWSSIAPQTPSPAERPSGNASFDAYRAELLDRLEHEQERFDGFLDRLRAAKDQGEFDQFMDDRAETVRQANPAPILPARA